jgi:hypothetical protein
MKKHILFACLIWSICVWQGQPLLAQTPKPSGAEDRAYWCSLLDKIARPVLDAASRGALKKEMPVEEHPGTKRADYAHLEALGRLLCGLGPWLELGPDNTPEGKIRSELIGLSRKAIVHGTDPASPDYMNFTKGGQPLVDAAFLAHALLRAPKQLWAGLEPAQQAQVIQALKLTRSIKPYESNWLLFAGMIEAFFIEAGVPHDSARLNYAIRRHQQWYKGDGIYGDGPDFHFDYYNSFVIHSMMVDILKVMSSKGLAPEPVFREAVRRASRYAEIQERLISPEGSYPAVGRSLPYRVGAFQTLAHVALMHRLPSDMQPAQVRCALTAVMKRQMEAPGTFDPSGWLQLGFAGHQPGVAETYLCTGSLYLCSVGFLPLGLPASDPFWTDPAADWTAKKAWSGQPFPIDKAE